MPTSTLAQIFLYFLSSYFWTLDVHLRPQKYVFFYISLKHVKYIISAGLIFRTSAKIVENSQENWNQNLALLKV